MLFHLKNKLQCYNLTESAKTFPYPSENKSMAKGGLKVSLILFFHAIKTQ
jgi:hypothetical protein